jgi:hypothetical protein
MAHSSEIETADRLVRRRARALPALAVVFVSQQAAFLTQAETSREVVRTVQYVQIGAWLALSVVLVLAVATGGFWFRSARVRALIDDESSRANRYDAMRFGFVAAMAGAMLLYVVTLLEPFEARDAIHTILSLGLAAALLRFGYLERRALRDG